MKKLTKKQSAFIVDCNKSLVWGKWPPLTGVVFYKTDGSRHRAANPHIFAPQENPEFAYHRVGECEYKGQKASICLDGDGTYFIDEFINGEVIP